MNTLAYPLLCLSLGQVPSPVVVPDPPSTLQMPPVEIDDAPARPNGLRVSDTSSQSREESYAESPATRQQRAFTQTQPSEQPRTAVVPAQRLEPIEPVQAEASIELANQILNEALRAASTRGTSTSLVSILSQGDTTRQSHAIHAYWGLSVAIARHAFAKSEATSLQQLGRPQSRTEESMLRARLSRASAREAELALAVLQHQQQLSDLIPRQSEKLPIPADVPFVGVYRTQIDKLFANQSAPRKLQQIDRALPFQLDLISRRAESIAACEQLLNDSSEAYTQGAGSLLAVLSAVSELSEERAKFLDAVRDYNRDIADYSLAVVRPGVPTSTLLATLIRAETAAKPTVFPDAGVRTASAEEPVNGSERRTGFSTQQAEQPSSPSPYTFRRRVSSGRE